MELKKGIQMNTLFPVVSGVWLLG